MKTAKPNGCAVTRSAGTHRKKRILGVILAGGRSSRMGRDKATLPFGGARLIDRVAARLRAALEEDRAAVGDQILVSGNVEGYACVADRVPELGPLGGIASVFHALAGDERWKNGDVAALLVVPVDMPSLTPEILSRLILAWRKSGCGFDGAAFFGHELPVILTVSGKVLRALEALCKPETAAASRSVRGLLGKLSVLKAVREDIQGREFLNVNTPGDLAGIRP